MRKLLIFLIGFFVISLPVSAEEYSSLDDLIIDVNEVAPVENSEIYVVDNEPVSVSDPVTENGDMGNGEELALLNEIATVLNETQAESLFNINSSQVEYFKGILLENPFYDYCVTFDGESTYRLYYGHNLDIGESANMASITRTSTGSGYNYYYSVITGSTGTVPSGNVYVSTITDGMPIFEEVEHAKSIKTLQIACVVALALWLLSKLFFR